MPLLDKFKNLFKSSTGAPEAKRPVGFQYVNRDINPLDIWDIIGELGDGAFGKVQKARHKEKDLLAAAKAIELSAEEDVDGFLVEIEILKEYPHKNVVGLHEAYFINSTLWIYLEFCGGGALDSIMIELEKSLTEQQIRYVCHEMCEGLRYLHSCYVIHRDLKAGNVLLTIDGQVKLADFGVSAKNKSEIHKRDSFIGTPYWMAPEVMMCETFKDDPYDCRADIWSLGITLIELAQRDPPYSEMTPNRVIIKIQKSEPPTLDRPELWSKDFNDVLRKCLQKKPDDRWTASDLLSHPFCRSANDCKSILQLLSEVRAEVIEEPVDYFEEDTQSHESVESEVTPERFSLADSQTEPEIANLSNENSRFVANLSKDSSRSSLVDTKPATISIDSNVFAQDETARQRYNDQDNEVLTNIVQENETNFEENTVDSVDLARNEELAPYNARLPEKRESTPVDSGEDSPTNAAANTILHDFDEMLNKEEESFITCTDEEIEPDAVKREDQNSKCTNELDDLHVHIPSASVQDWNDSASSDDPSRVRQHSSPRAHVSGIKAMFEHTAAEVAENEKPPPAAKLERHPSQVSAALKQKFEQAAANAASASQKEKSSSRESFDIPEGVIRRSKNNILRPVSVEGTSSGNEINAASSSIQSAEKNRKSVSEIKQEFELSRQHSDSTVVKRDSFNSSTSSGESPGISRKRRSMPPSVNFMERANAVGALLEQSISGKTQNNNPSRRNSENVDRGADVMTRSVDNSERPVFEKDNDAQQRRLRNSLTGSVHVFLVKPSHDDEFPHAPPPPDPPVDYESSSGAPGSGKPHNPAPPPTTAGDSCKEDDSHFVRPKTPPLRPHVENGTAKPNRNSSTVSTATNNSIVFRKSNEESMQESDISSISEKEKGKGKMTKKTRVYVVDGVQVTSTTYHVMAGEGTRNYKAKEDFNLRKAELQELRRLQKEETKQFQNLAVKTQILREQQERKFEDDMQNCIRQFDYDVELMIKTHKKQLEEAERIQDEDLRLSSKKLKQDQDKELKNFRESLKQEQKLLKQEVDILPKNDRKEMFKRRKDALDYEQVEREKQYTEMQQRELDASIRRLQESHRQKIALLEKQFLQQKHQLLRGKEAAMWELEKKQMHEKHQLAKNQLKEIFFLQRTQMLNRHNRELDHVRKLNARKEDELSRNQITERRRLPKILRSETKTRTLMFRESLKIRNESDLTRKVRDFEEQEQKRIQREMKKQEQKHKKRMDILKAENEAALTELQQMQNEKRKMLVEHETLKMKQYDDEHSADMKKWQSQLKPRKQGLEEKFAQELYQQEQFYQVSSNGAASNSSGGHISSLLLAGPN